MANVKYSPLNRQFLDQNGNPAAGHKLTSYAAGSSSLLPTYTDSTGTVANPNPIILNSLGYPPNQIWQAAGLQYQFMLADANGVDYRTEDDVPGINDAAVATSQWQSSGVTPTYISASSFSVPGDQTSEFHVGRLLQLTTTAGTVYGAITGSTYNGSTLTTVTVSLDGGALDSGLSAVNLSILRGDHLALPKRDYVVNDINASSQNGGALAGHRNRLINGNFAINQRAVTGTVTLAAGAYGHDRWKAGAGGCTYTFSTSGNDTVVNITAGSLMQVIEGANVEGGQYTLNNGGGSAQMRAAINGAATSGSYSAGPIVTSTANGGQNITVEFTTGTVGKLQLEPGMTATPFERRSIATELAMCQRYYEIGTFNISGSSPAATVNWQLTVPFKASKRVTPTVLKLSDLLASNVASMSAGSGGLDQMFGTVQNNTAAAFQGQFIWSASAEL